MNRKSDRHSYKRTYLSGSEKREIAADKQKKETDLPSQTKRFRRPSSSFATEPGRFSIRI